MPCVTCVSWRPPSPVTSGRGGRNAPGHCDLDGQLSHPHYHCPRHQSAAARADTAGLTDDEIAWLRTNTWAPAARELTRLYRLIEVAPQVETLGARATFVAALRKWRDRRTGEETFRLREIAARVD